MIASRATVRTARGLRVARQRAQQSRAQSTTTSTTHANPAITGALAGGLAAVSIGYGWYHFSGTKTIVKTARETQSYINSAQEKFKKQVQDKAPSPNEALQWLRQVSTFYAGFIPGASGYVNTAFDDLDKVHSKHGDEVDAIVKEAYEEVKSASQKGVSLQTAEQVWEILQKHVKRIGELAGDAFEDILDNHPKLKESVGGNIDKLKEMGDQYGPEAKKQVDETWNQIKDVAKKGISAGSISDIKKLVEEKVEQLKKLGDEAWKKGFEQAKPFLDKNPKVKELVEDNAEALKQGNVGELFKKAKKAVDEGSTEDLEKYVKEAKKKVEGKVPGGLDQYLKAIPGSEQVFSKLQQIQEIAKSKGPDAQKLMDQTVKEISDVLSKKSEEAKKIADDAKKQA